MFKLQRLVTGLIVVLFCMAAIVKMTDQLDKKATDIMKKEFVRFAKVNPLTLLFKYEMDPMKLMRAYGIIEGLVGVLTLIGTKPVKILASIVGTGVMATTIQMLLVLGDPRYKMIPASFAIGCLLLNIYLLATTKDEEDVKTTKTE